MTEQSSIPVEAQAVPGQPVANRLADKCERLAEWEPCDCGCPSGKSPKTAKDVALIQAAAALRRPTPAAADLHQQYVYVRLIRPEGYEDVHPELLVADAHIHPTFEPEIVAASPAAAADWKLVPIEPTKEMLGAICEAEFLRKPANAVYAAVLAASPVALNIRDNSQYQRNPQMMPIETAPKGGSFLAKDEHGWEVWNADAYWSAIAADAPAHMPRNEARALTHWHPLPGASYAAAAALQQQFHHETWWLLESTVTPRPCYYAGPRRAPRDNRVIDGITENANKAVRFSDESAAKLMVAMLADVDTSKPTWPLEAATKGCWKASEHMFDYTPRTKEQE